MISFGQKEYFRGTTAHFFHESKFCWLFSFHERWKDTAMWKYSTADDVDREFVEDFQHIF